MEQYNYPYELHAYDELLDVMSNTRSSISIRRKYEAMYHTLVFALNYYTKDLYIEFSGPFARLDYLCRNLNYRESHPQAYLQICGFRGRATHLIDYTDSQLELAIAVDLRALCEFLSTLNRQPVPKVLQCLQAPDYPIREHHENLGNVLRCSVWKLTEQDIDVHDVEGHSYQLPWLYAFNLTRKVDLTYLRPMLRIGSQLNLVKPREVDGKIIAEQVIFEPDLLIDISAVSKCFSGVGATPYYYLLQRFESTDATPATLLGNFAGQMLDEEIHGPKTYQESISNFFAINALSVVTCHEMQQYGKLQEFHEQARQQQQNIRQMVTHSFTQDRSIQIDKVVLEPSFYCEMLGLQGRMDLMQSDKHVIMEQKSGKMDEYRHQHQQTHFVQVLLYQAMLHYGYKNVDGKPLRNDDISTYLLYSRYPDGLLKEAPAPLLLEKALKIRNQMAYIDLLLSRGQARTLLFQLKPEHFNPENQHGRFWEEYIRPGIELKLNLLQQSPALELAYFYRMLQFLAREHILSKMGTSQKEASGFAALWNSTVQEKREAGNLMDGLSILEIGEHLDLIKLTVNQADDVILPNFRVGDIVVLYSYRKDQQPDARQDLVFRASIANMSTSELTLQLRAPQRNVSLFLEDTDKLWAIEHDYMESSNTGLYRGLYSFLQARPERRQLLLGERQPQFDKNCTLIGNYGVHNTLVLKAKQAQDYFLLVGPPGTGKTSFGLVNILKETLLTPTVDGHHTNILLVSYTNRAVDEICSKLQQFNEPYIRIGNELSCAEEFKPNLLSVLTRQCRTAQEIKNLLLGRRIFVGTTSTMTTNLSLFELKEFDLCIIDEASQILEPHLLALLSVQHAGKNAIRKFVMIGDHKQLPAVVQQSEKESEVVDEMLRKIGLYNCRQSLFERLIRLNTAAGGEGIYTLSSQGRMHHEVADFPNLAFYQGQLKEVPLEHQERPIPYQTAHPENEMLKNLTTNRISFIDIQKSAEVYITESSEQTHSNSDKTNPAEAKYIAKLVLAVWQMFEENKLKFKPTESVGVIVPYRHQIATIRQELEKFKKTELLNITIDTVERYQGSQRDIIIYGFTISKAYQLEFLTDQSFVEHGKLIDRKLNVALTRAREIMVLVGDAKILQLDPLFNELIQYCKSKQKE